MAQGKTPRFSPKSIRFLQTASRQKNPNWLSKNRTEFEEVILGPLQKLASVLKTELAGEATGYHFPQKGIGRIKVTAQRAAERGGRHFKSWLTYTSARPRTSRFEHNPNLFFMINSTDPKDPVLLAGGLYMPSSKQTRAIREAIARDASAFEKLFAAKDFAKIFPKGFSDERISSRPTRGYDPNHPKMHWLRLQGFFVWKPYSRKEFASENFAELVARDCRQILRLNKLLDAAIAGRLPVNDRKLAARPQELKDKLLGFEYVRPAPQF